MPSYALAVLLAVALAAAPHAASALGLEGTRFLGQLSVPQVVGRIIKALFGLAGVAALAMFIYGGAIILVADSDSGVKKGREALTNAAIGLGLMFTAYSVTNWVIDLLSAAALK